MQSLTALGLIVYRGKIRLSRPYQYQKVNPIDVWCLVLIQHIVLRALCLVT